MAVPWGGGPRDRVEIYAHLACEPGSACCPDTKGMSSVAQATVSRRTERRQEELVTARQTKYRRTEPAAKDRPLPTSAQLLLNPFWSSHIHDSVPRSCYEGFRQLPRGGLRRFSQASAPDSPDFARIQLEFFRFLFIFTFGLMRRLYPGEEGSVERAGKAADLRARIHRLLASPSAITTLCWERCDAAQDAALGTHRTRRRTLDPLEARAASVWRMRHFDSRGAASRAVKALLHSRPADLRELDT